MKKILHILPSLRRGGTETYVMNNFRKTDREMFNYDFYVLTDKYDQFKDEINELGGSIYYCKVKHFRERYFLSIIQDLRKHIKINGPYSAVHVHIDLSNAWFVLGARIAGVKQVISHAHGILTPKDNTISKITVIIKKYINNRFSTIKLACSEEAGISLYGEKVFKNSGKVVKNGIKVEDFLNVSAKDLLLLREKYCIPSNAFVLGNITRFDSNKNQLFILEIFKSILIKKPNSILILGGPDGGTKEFVQEKSNSLGIAEKVRFIGETDAVNIWLNIFDAYIFPSIREGFGIALLEAQASALNCFVSNTITKNIDMGLDLISFLELSDSAEKWAEAILKNTCNSIREISREDIKSAFDKNGYALEKSVKDLERIYLHS